MPVRELQCDTETCEYHGIIWEWFASRTSKPDPLCPKCKAQMRRLFSSFNTPFIGTLDRLEKSGMERFNKYKDGHWAWKTKSTRNVDGSPERVLIRTRAEQQEYCKAEGLIPPDEVHSNSYISVDGKTLIEGQTWRDLPGAITQRGNPWLEVEE